MQWGRMGPIPRFPLYNSLRNGLSSRLRGSRCRGRCPALRRYQKCEPKCMITLNASNVVAKEHKFGGPLGHKNECTAAVTCRSGLNHHGRCVHALRVAQRADGSVRTRMPDVCSTKLANGQIWTCKKNEVAAYPNIFHFGKVITRQAK